ncbi:uncharacterized protein LOC112506230 [Cynara cardunculus var. scolymus]|uniref:uncharacterized protein LOC112506230 n=1 Tax=Cynara cardunculus var. scolymus TaxID=59895 RepID=UPI000D624877|nr:uncharacterized protein LOC112506230 [Cynara cardunculus var. scolymus]
MRNPSGSSEQDIMNEAKELLKLDGSYKNGFKFDHVWDILKDSESLSNVTASTQYQRQSPYQSPSSGPGSSSVIDAGLPSLTIDDVEDFGTDRKSKKNSKSRGLRIKSSADYNGEEDDDRSGSINPASNCIFE